MTKMSEGSCEVFRRRTAIQIQNEWECVYVSHDLVEETIRFELRNRRIRVPLSLAVTTIASAVSHDGKCIADVGVFEDFIVILLNLQACLAYTRGVHEREREGVVYRHFQLDGEQSVVLL